MQHAQTIAMAQGLLAEGRETDVAQMISPLLSPLDEAEDAVGQIRMRTLLARVRLFRYGDAAGSHALLAAYASRTTRAELTALLRAEVALWLGWTHAWQDADIYDDARALNLLDEAARLFQEEHDTRGRCWTYLGQAQAYFTIDEFPLMLQALEKASALQEKLQDAQITLWIHDLSVRGAHVLGQYAKAQTHIDALQALGRQHHNTLALSRAHAYQAALYHETGRPPQVIFEEAQKAEALSTNGAIKAGYPLLAAYRAHVLALIRKGETDTADQVIGEGIAATSDVLGAQEHLLVQRARLLLIKGQYAAAEGILDQVLSRMHRFQHRLLASSIALVRSEQSARLNENERAYDWAQRAYQSARETGHRSQQLRALFYLARYALVMGDTPQARTHLAEAEHYDAYFSILPLAALRFRTLGYLALQEDQTQDARTYFAQALSAYSLIDDRYHTALVQLELAHLGHQTDPARTRPLLEAAILTFNQYQAAAPLEEAQALLQRWPEEGHQASEAMESTIGALLARASLSVDLVAESWLQAVSRLLPDRWRAFYRASPEGVWECLRSHGHMPTTVRYPKSSISVAHQEGICWIQLRSHPGPAFYCALGTPGPDDPAWLVAMARLKPWLPVATLALDHALLRAQRLDPELARYDEPTLTTPLEGFIQTSAPMQAVVQQIHRCRASHSPVLITGESGTGKELIARAVHASSERSKAPLIAFNCSNVPHDLFDSHLFGHEKGAFTGANQAHPGVIRSADGATLFLDEIGDLPLDVQPKLLRFLQEGEVFPLGAKRPVQVNVRVVAATNQDLEQRIREGRFREDLYYRLNVIPIRVPPLRERREEIPLLVRHFLGLLAAAGAPMPSITNRAMEALLRYDWPGNVRQLRNEIERALVFVGSEPAPLIDLKDLSPPVVEAAGTVVPVVSTDVVDQILQPGHDLEQVLAVTEKALIERVLAETQGQVTGAADMLGLTRQGLYKKMKRLGVEPGHYQKREPKATTTSLLHLN